MRIVRTDGSIVGDGVRASTSISMTFSCSLAVPQHSSIHHKSASVIPVSKSANTFPKISSRLILRIHKHLDIYFRQFLRDQVPKVLGELVIIAESVLTTLHMSLAAIRHQAVESGWKRYLEAVDEAEYKCLLHDAVELMWLLDGGVVDGG